MQIKPGQKYRHYKGHDCKVIGIGRHSETLEELVFYIQLGINEEYGENSVWARPMKMWFEEVELAGKKVPRFVLVSEK